MSAQSNARPIIKRKKIVQGGGHHGGAWKVAYADFVTAMMAFFMLMWLLGATTEKQRKGLADYFNPTVTVNRTSGGGAGVFGGDSVFAEDTLSRSGTGAGLTAESGQGAAGTAEAQEEAQGEADKALAAVEEKLMGLTGESIVRDLIRRHIVTRISDQGLVIELFDTEETPLFDADALPRAELRILMPTIVEALTLVENSVSVDSHVARADPPARSAWDRSIDRGAAVRGLLEGAALPPARMLRVTGLADRKPVAADPSAARNNRIEIVVLRDLD
jgi:chemotaxis protein MotB